jgi:predicted nucleotidyltransferase component of viral defense system
MQLKARIKNLAAKNHIPAQAVLQNFMLERLLERISVSKYKNKIVLKGGVLIASMVGIHSRTTMDMDATLRGFALNEASIREAFSEISAITLEDEVTLRLDHIAPIREDDEYGGFRIAMIASYESIQTPLKIDLTAGDVITPEAVRYCFPLHFDDRQIEIWAYPIETILAEKVETILRRSVLNTRPRDYYDVYILTSTYRNEIHQGTFHRALHATAAKRESLPMLIAAVTILENIQQDEVMRQRWERYCKENAYAQGIPFDEVLRVLNGYFNEDSSI